MRWLGLLMLCVVTGCSSSAPCPVDLADVGCTRTPECADAGEGMPCARPQAACTLCVPSYHSYLAR